MGLAALLWPHNGPDSKPLASRKLILMHRKSSKNTGQPFPTTETSTQYQLFDATSLPEVFPASRFPSPGSDEARLMTVTSGRQCATLLDDADPLGCLVKTCLESSAWNSTKCLLTWRALAIGSNRLLFRLVPLMPSTEGTEFGLWPTPEALNQEGYQVAGNKKYPRLGAMVKLWPTPRATPGNFSKVNGKIYETSLQSMARRGLLWPTPCNRDYRGQHGKDSKAFLDRMKYRSGVNLVEQLQREGINGQLNPTWVEWLMGFPIGHTVCDLWATLSSRKSPKSSCKPSTKN